MPLLGVSAELFVHSDGRIYVTQRTSRNSKENDLFTDTETPGDISVLLVEKADRARKYHRMWKWADGEFDLPLDFCQLFVRERERLECWVVGPQSDESKLRRHDAAAAVDLFSQQCLKIKAGMVSSIFLFSTLQDHVEAQRDHPAMGSPAYRNMTGFGCLCRQISLNIARFTRNVFAETAEHGANKYSVAAMKKRIPASIRHMAARSARQKSENERPIRRRGQEMKRRIDKKMKLMRLCIKWEKVTG